MKSPEREIWHHHVKSGEIRWVLPGYVNARIAEWQTYKSDSWKQLKRFYQNRLVRFMRVLLTVTNIYSLSDLNRYVAIIDRNLAHMELEIDDLMKNPSAADDIESGTIETEGEFENAEPP